MSLLATPRLGVSRKSPRSLSGSDNAGMMVMVSWGGTGGEGGGRGGYNEMGGSWG